MLSVHMLRHNVQVGSQQLAAGGTVHYVCLFHSSNSEYHVPLTATDSTTAASYHYHYHYHYYYF